MKARKVLPEFIAGAIFTLFICTVFWNTEHSNKYMVYSDGHGFYAFLPALFIQQDISFVSTDRIEREVRKPWAHPNYLMTDSKGNNYNKCHPGVALLQMPFFMIALAIDSIGGAELTGYSNTFMYIYQLGAIFYSILGLFFLRKYLELVCGNKRIAIITSLFIFFGTNLFFMVMHRPSYTHHFSFSLFAIFAYLVKLYSLHGRRSHAWYLGGILGLISLVRPVNIIILLAIPLITGNGQALKALFARILTIKNLHLMGGILAFSLAISPLFILNYAQTGSLIIWSYQGEGFNFSSPEIREELFGFRNGVYMHTPLLMLSLIGLYYMYKANRFLLVSWLSYVLFLAFLLGSWWSWDFSGCYGNRAVIEHLVFLSLPLLFLLLNLGKSKLLFGLLCLSTLFMWSRSYQLHNGLIPERHTSTTFFKSIFCLEAMRAREFEFPSDLPPYGQITDSKKIIDHHIPTIIDEKTLYAYTVDVKFPEDYIGNRFFFEFEIRKQLLGGNDWKEVFIVLDFTSSHSDDRIFKAIPMYYYFKEGADEAVNFKMDQEYYANPRNNIDQVRIYLFNNKGKRFKIESFECTYHEYSPL